MADLLLLALMCALVIVAALLTLTADLLSRWQATRRWIPVAVIGIPILMVGFVVLVLLGTATSAEASAKATLAAKGVAEAVACVPLGALGAALTAAPALVLIRRRGGAGPEAG